MGIDYALGILVVLIINYDKIPSAIALIFKFAFAGMAPAGGFAGSTVAAALCWGVTRGVFSNESGLGSAPSHKPSPAPVFQFVRA